MIIGTTRFSTATFEQNHAWRGGRPGCVYGLNRRLPRKIKKGAVVHVIEMCNTTNKVMGIGIITNRCIFRDDEYRIYSDQNYNRYIYIGKERVDRSAIKDKVFLEKLEKALFYGKGHMKRGQSVTVMPRSKLEGVEEFIQGLTS
jgi:hypothetical protein